MFDASSMKDWGRDQASEVAADWRQVIALAENHRDSYLKDAAGNMMFFLFGATPAPGPAVLCQPCAFYAQDANGLSTLRHAAGAHGAFAWVEPPQGLPLDYLRAFYTRKCGTMFPDSPTPCVGAAFAGLEAVYPDHSSIPRSTALLRDTLKLCAEHTNICQVPTWNDFNEGTHIQPSYWCNGLQPDAYLDILREFKLSMESELAVSVSAAGAQLRGPWPLSMPGLLGALVVWAAGGRHVGQ